MASQINGLPLRHTPQEIVRGERSDPSARGGGLVSGMLTPRLPDLIDRLDGVPRFCDWRSSIPRLASMTSVLFPVWQAVVAVRLAIALRAGLSK